MLRMIIAIAVMTAATQLTRYFPFLLFSRRQPPGWLLTGSRLIPGAVMMVLVIYSMPHNLNFTSPGNMAFLGRCCLGQRAASAVQASARQHIRRHRGLYDPASFFRVNRSICR